MEVQLSFVPEVLATSSTSVNVDLDTKMTCQMDLEVHVVFEGSATQHTSRKGGLQIQIALLINTGISLSETNKREQRAFVYFNN